MPTMRPAASAGAMTTYPPVMDLLTVLVKQANTPAPVFRVVVPFLDGLRSRKLCIHHLHQQFKNVYRFPVVNQPWLHREATKDELLKRMTQAQNPDGYITDVMGGYSCKHCSKEQRRRQKQMYQETFRNNEAWGEKPAHKR